MRAERCVVDTNVLISALLQPSGRTADVLHAIRADGTLVFSDETSAEVGARLMRPKFDRYIDQAPPPRNGRESTAQVAFVRRQGSGQKVVNPMSTSRDPRR
jgi:predicted nucleic acid-binding protein